MLVFSELDMGEVPFTKSNVSCRNLSSMNLNALRPDLSNSDLCKNTDTFDVNELAICYSKEKLNENGEELNSYKSIRKTI